jgi:hypothetical protein
VAHGDAIETSDIDLLVDLDDGRGLFDLGGLLMDLQELLGQNVDVVTEAGLRSRVAQAGVGRRSRLVRSDRDRLLDMLEMCDLLIAHASDDVTLATDPVVQAAAQRWIEVLVRPTRVVMISDRARETDTSGRAPWDQAFVDGSRSDARSTLRQI